MAIRRVLTWWRLPLPRWAEVACLLLILALAACFRLYQIGHVPPGPHYDEAAAALDALDVLDGRHMIFSPRSYGREMLFVYVAAPLVALLGPTLLALRLPIALVGTLTVLATYLLARELFDEEEKRKAQVTALLAALFLAISFWHLALNHLSFRANYLPLTEVLCFLFLWRAVRTGRPGAYVASGFFLGLSLYTYTSARFVPIVLVVFFSVLLLTRKGRELIIPRWRSWVLLGIVALLVFAPLLTYFVSHSEDFMLRARGVSILNPHLHQGDLGGLFVRSLLGNLGLFGFAGDENWVYNIPGRPGLDLVQAVLFWLGLVLCLTRWRQPRYLFLVVWWLIMLLPSILAPDPIPHSLRAIGTLPVVCIISARALAGLLSPLPLRSRRLRTAIPLALLAVLPFYLLWAGYNTWHDYFDDWRQREEVYYAYYGHMADLAEQINRDTDPEAVYIFPVNYDRRGEDYREYPLELLHRSSVPFHYIFVDDATVARDLTDISAGKSRVHLIVWTHGNHVDADPRQVLPFFLEKFGQKVEERAFRGYRIVTYELPSAAVDFAAPFDFAAVQASFGHELRLVAQAHDPSTPSGETTLIALRWQTQQAPAHDYKASLRLFDEQGHLAGQSDTWLLSNEHQATGRWEPGQVVTSYHLLPTLPATVPGTYQLYLALYDPETLTQVQLMDEEGVPVGDRLALGPVEINRPWRRGAVEPEVPLAEVHLAPDLDLVGYSLDRELVGPGETMYLALYWLAQAEIARDYTVIMQLVGEGGEVAAEWAEGPAYPTSEWQANDLWRDRHDLRLAPDMSAGKYQLVVQLAATESGRLAPAKLGWVEVQGPGRLFQVPAISHPQVAQLGEEIRFLGYDLGEEQVRPGETLHLTLYWQAVTEGDISYTVFTHLLDGNARLWGQKDNVPGGGALPTTGWVSQEVIVDQYQIPISADAPPGEYVVEIGMYQGATGQRLPILDEMGKALGDHLLLDTKISLVH